MVSMMLHSLLYGGRETPGNNLGVHYALSLCTCTYPEGLSGHKKGADFIIYAL